MLIAVDGGASDACADGDSNDDEVIDLIFAGIFIHFLPPQDHFIIVTLLNSF